MVKDHMFPLRICSRLMLVYGKFMGVMLMAGAYAPDKIVPDPDELFLGMAVYGIADVTGYIANYIHTRDQREELRDNTNERMDRIEERFSELEEQAQREV